MNKYVSFPFHTFVVIFVLRYSRSKPDKRRKRFDLEFFKIILLVYLSMIFVMKIRNLYVLHMYIYIYTYATDLKASRFANLPRTHRLYP